MNSTIDFFKSVLLSTLIVIPAFAFSQSDSLTEKRVLTLPEVIAAISQNPYLRAFDDKIQSYGAYAKGAKSWDAPKVVGGLWMTPYNIEQNKNMGMVMIGAEQMIPNPSKQKAEQNFMQGMTSVEKTMKSFETQDMIEEAKKTYYEWIILEKQLKVLEESERLITLMITSGEINYTYNQGMLGRIYKAKSELYNLQNTEIVNRNEIRQKNIRVNTLMNISKEAVYTIDTTYVIYNYEKIEIDTAALEKNRSDLRNIDESIKLFRLKTTMESSKRKPDFGIQYWHMNSFGNQPNLFTLMGSVSIPIVPWAAKKYNANIEGIKYETASLLLKKEAILNNTLGEVQKIRSEMASKKKQVLMYEKNIIPALQKNYNASLIAFEHMKEDMFMTIDAWNTLKMAKVEYLTLLGELLKMQAEYERQIEE